MILVCLHFRIFLTDLLVGGALRRGRGILVNSLKGCPIPVLLSFSSGISSSMYLAAVRNAL